MQVPCGKEEFPYLEDTNFITLQVHLFVDTFVLRMPKKQHSNLHINDTDKLVTYQLIELNFNTRSIKRPEYCFKLLDQK